MASPPRSDTSHLFFGLLLALTSCSSGDGPENGGTDGGAQSLCLNISGSVTSGALSIRKPEAEAKGCKAIPGDQPDEEVCEPKAPDLACVGNIEAAGASIDIILTGCVNSFGLEAQSDDLTVTVLRERVNGATTDPGYDLAGAPGAQAEKTRDARVGSTISTQVPKERCTDLGHFEIRGVPTETPLIVRVTDQHVARDLRQYVDTYQYNALYKSADIKTGPNPDSPLLSDDETVTDPAAYCRTNDCYVVDDVNTVIETTFKTIALTAGVSQIDGSTNLYDGEGQGHVAGAIQDCTSDDTIQNAVVALSVPVKKLAYFNVDFPPSTANLEDPKVDQSRSRTNADGIYAAIAVDTAAGGQAVDLGAAVTTSICGEDGVCPCADGKPNPAHTSADAREGEVLVLGKRNIYVYPDSITILTFDRRLYTSP